MRCPDCHAPLIDDLLHEQPVNRCPQCQGIRIRGEALSIVLKQSPPSNSLDGREKISEAGSGPPTDSIRQDKICSGCRGAMLPIEYAYDSGVMIQRCKSCSSIWLPPGKLNELQEYRVGSPSVEALAQAWEEKFRRANRWKMGWHLLKSRLLSGVVAIICLSVALTTTGLETAAELGAFLFLPLFCIWFCDGIQWLIFTRIFGETKRTTSYFIAIGGWLLLLASLYAWVAGFLSNRAVFL